MNPEFDRITVPYPKSYIKGSGVNIRVVRICPACGAEFEETTDQVGEQTTNNYGAHFDAEHRRPDGGWAMPNSTTPQGAP